DVDMRAPDKNASSTSAVDRSTGLGPIVHRTPRIACLTFRLRKTVTKLLYLAQPTREASSTRTSIQECIMNTSAITTRTANTAEHAIVTELCLAAFADEAVIAWVFPDPVVRHHF